MTTGTLLLAVTLLGQGAQVVADTGLDAVKRLYAMAVYGDALERLSLLDGREDPNQLDQFRALCLLGLGRASDADQVLERIVLRSPRFRVAANEVSPAFLARFASIRTRVLPVAAHRAYTRAKTSFELRDYSGASEQLRDLVAVLKEQTTSGNQSLANLQQLAGGLLRLSEAELAAANRQIYSALDLHVTAPVEIERLLPAWNPPSHLRWRPFRGVVEVVVDERGSVASARLVESLADFYDAALLDAARGWRFTPAMRDGQAVKYRKLIEITMRPQ